MKRAQIRGGEIWVVRILLAIAMLIFLPPWLAGSPPSELVYRIAGVLILVAVAFGEWAKKLVSWIARTALGRRRF